MENKKRIHKLDTKTILSSLLESDFFDDWKTTSDVIKKLNNKGFTIKGKEIGIVSKLLTQMCQDFKNHLEREEIPKEKRIKQEHWMFRREK